MNEQMKREMLEACQEREFREGRLLSCEKQIRIGAMYYAVMACIVAILSLVYPQHRFSALSVVMTAALSMMVMALCMQRYTVRAQKLRHEYVILKRLMAEENGEKAGQYLEILAADEGLSAHEQRMVQRMHDRQQDGEKKLYGYEKFLYWFFEIVLIVVKTIIVLAPAAGIALVAAKVI